MPAPISDPLTATPSQAAAGSTKSSLIGSWADAIQKFEGWFAGSRSFRNNNPGNLRVAGDLGVDASGYGVFSTYDLGRSALVSDLTAKVQKYGGQTLAQVMQRYAPASDGNDPLAYATYVAQRLGVGISDTLNQIFGG